MIRNDPTGNNGLSSFLTSAGSIPRSSAANNKADLFHTSSACCEVIDSTIHSSDFANESAN
jgi:hypothetical protein